MIDFLDVSVNFGAQAVLDGVSFRIGPGDRIGIVGPNGAGKSTVFNLLTGELQPDRGKITRERNLSIGYLRQQLRPYAVDCSLLEYAENAMSEIQRLQREIEELEAGLGALEESERGKQLRKLGTLQTEFEHSGGYELSTRAKTALCGLGFSVNDLHLPFRSFSGGWQMRAELARALVSRPDLLLLDEPTNFLDIPAVEWLQRYLREFKGTFLLIAHDRFLLNTLTSSTLEVADKKVTRYPGNYDYYVRERALRTEQLLAAKKNQDRQRAQVERFIERFRAKNTKASQVQSRVKMLEKMEEIVIPREAIRPARIRLPRPARCGEEVMRLEGAGITYDGQTWVFRNMDLRVQRGEKTALVGLNGLGKTTLLRVLAGRLPLLEGKMVVGHKVRIGYQAQDFTETMDPALTVFTTARNAAPRMAESELRTVLGSFFFSGDAIEKQVEVLSGGEKMRLSLARILLQAPNCLLLDEPTTHLDIPSREALEQALISYEGTLFIVSHDIEFVRRVATGIIALVPQNIRRFPGGYDYYHEKTEQERLAMEAAAPRNEEKETPASSRKALRQARAQQREEFNRATKDIKQRITQSEKQIDVFVQEQKKLLDMLAMAETDPNLNYSEIGRRLKLIQDEINNYTKRWEQDTTELEQVMKQFEEEKEQGSGFGVQGEMGVF